MNKFIIHYLYNVVFDTLSVNRQSEIDKDYQARCNHALLQRLHLSVNRFNINNPNDNKENIANQGDESNVLSAKSIFYISL